VRARDRRPESVPALLPHGQLVSGEAIDHPGDIDDFEIALAAGQYATVLGRLGPGAVPRTGTQVGSVIRDLANEWTIHHTILAASPGLHPLRVASLPTGPSPARFHGHGPYELRVIVGNSAPESISAVISVGDTIRGESIDDIGDVDVFEFDAVAGDHLRLYVNAMGRTLALTVWDDADNQIGTVPLTCANVCSWGSYPGTMPRTGRYRLRIQGRTLETGPYEFALTREAN
jgi:hypothetical protein